MPKLKKNKLPAYRLHRRSGQAIVTLCGKDFYLGPHNSQVSKNEYDRLIAEWLTNGRQLCLGNGSDVDITITELLAKYVAHAKEYYVKDGRLTSEYACIKSFAKILRRLYGRTEAVEFGPLALKVTRDQFVKENWSRNTVNKQVSRIKLMFKWAVSNELIPPSVYQALQTVSGLRRGRSKARETTPVKPVPDEHVDAIKPYVSRQVWAMIELQRLTGMRSGEVIIMRASDIDMTGEIWHYRPGSHKTEHHGHERVVELGPKAQAIVKVFLQVDTQAYLFSPAVAEEERKKDMRRCRKSPVQPSQRNRRKKNPKRKPKDHYTTDSYRRAIKRACDSANMAAAATDPDKTGSKRLISCWHPHQLRHNFATMIRKKHGLETARVLLGHKTMAVTEIYAEIDRAKVADIVAKVG